MNTTIGFKVLKILTIIVLIGLFVWNSTIVFKYFIAAKKVTSSEDQTNEALVPPAIFVCREVAFTDDMKDMAKLDDFFDNTLYLNYTIYNAENDISELSNHGIKNEPTVVTSEEVIVNASQSVYETHFKLEYVYSYSRGLCYKFLFLKKVNMQLHC